MCSKFALERFKVKKGTLSLFLFSFGTSISNWMIKWSVLIDKGGSDRIDNVISIRSKVLPCEWVGWEIICDKLIQGQGHIAVQTLYRWAW